MPNCPQCNSNSVRSKGYRKHGKQGVVAYSCSTCETTFSIPYEKNQTQLGDTDSYIKPPEYIEDLRKNTRFVITSATAGCSVNVPFLNALQKYLEVNEGKLLVLPVKSVKGRGFDPILQQQLIYNNFSVVDNLNILGALQLSATLEHPLAGLDPISRGSTLIIGHPQVALKTMPVQNRVYPPIITTTGSITENDYTVTKQGYKANFNHSFSAVLVEIDGRKNIFLRHLNFDGQGFYDLGDYYTADGVDYNSPTNSAVDALVTGDEHVMFASKTVAEATYINSDSIVKTLRPKVIVRHDVLDSYSISHHHRGNVFTQYAKWQSGFHSLERELEEVISFLNSTTPDYSETRIVASNHNDHLLRWLREVDPKQEPWNAKLYHQLMYMMLERTEMTFEGAKYPDPFELYAMPRLNNNVHFIGRGENLIMHDIQMSAHGDVGTNGARGSRKQFSILPEKYIIGHSHSPGIEKGTYQVGTSSNLKLEYNVGASSWHHCHCVVYKNGKRQLIFIVNGKWRPRHF